MEDCTYKESKAKCYDHCSSHQKDSCHPYSNRTLCFSHPIQIQGTIFLHYDPSAGYLNIESCLCSSLCHCINLALSLSLNRRFKHGIIGEYHMTFAGTLFRGGSPSTSPRSSFLICNAMHCIRDMHPNSRTRLGRG